MRTGLAPAAYSRTMFTQLDKLPVRRMPSRVANRQPLPDGDSPASLVRDIGRKPGQVFLGLIRNALARKWDSREVGSPIFTAVHKSFPGFSRQDARTALDFAGLTQVEV